MNRAIPCVPTEPDAPHEYTCSTSEATCSEAVTVCGVLLDVPSEPEPVA